MKKYLVLLSLSPPVAGSIVALSAGESQPGSFVRVHAAFAPSSRGDELFAEKGCVYCHGANGVGIPDKAPSLLTVGKRLKKEAIARQIHDGGKGMPAFGEALQPDEINALVEMLAKRKKPPKTMQASQSPETR